MTSPPLACVMDAIPPEARADHAELSRRLFAGAERSRLPDGYAFRFEAEQLADLARFIEHERRCCPFLTFTLEQEPEMGPIRLRLTGPAGTPGFLETELPGMG